jgi:hypothetical protein
MRLTAPPQINVVRKEEKEPRLRDFVLRDLLARAQGLATGSPIYLLIARSLDSPVARALLSVSGEAAAAGIRLNMLLMLDEVARDMDPAAGDHLASIDARLATDMRLLDAHEFLVLGPSTVWIGDCMRRDPAKRDAYEFYGEDTVEAARSAARSFERLWAGASPLLLRRLPCDVPDAAAIAAEAAPASPVEASTRH